MTILSGKKKGNNEMPPKNATNYDFYVNEFSLGAIESLSTLSSGVCTTSSDCSDIETTTGTTSTTFTFDYNPNFKFPDDVYESILKSCSNFGSKKETEKETMNYPKVKSIRYEKNKENKNYTTVTWMDGTKTTVRCSDGDEYSRYDGFCSALAKKIFGTSSQVRKIVESKDEAIEIAKKKAEQEELNRIAEIKRNRKMRHQIKYRAKQIVIEKEAKKLAKEMMGE